MKNFKLASSIGVLLVLTGCSTIKPSEPEYKDYQPLMVGKPIAQRVADSQNEVNNQLALLERIASGKHVGSYNVVEHNQGLDARVGSAQTVPQDYAHNLFDIEAAKQPMFTPTDKASQLKPNRPSVQRVVKKEVGVINAVKEEVDVNGNVVEVAVVSEIKPVSTKILNVPIPEDPALNQVVDHIAWENNSLNELAQHLADQIGYSLVTKDGSVKDAKITYTSKDKTIKQVIKDLQKQTSGLAEIVIIEANQTFNIFYK